MTISQWRRHILATLCLTLTGAATALAQPEEASNGQISDHAGTALAWNARALAAGAGRAPLGSTVQPLPGCPHVFD